MINGHMPRAQWGGPTIMSARDFNGALLALPLPAIPVS
jgi:hypothetical protein